MDDKLDVSVEIKGRGLFSGQMRSMCSVQLMWRNAAGVAVKSVTVVVPIPTEDDVPIVEVERRAIHAANQLLERAAALHPKDLARNLSEARNPSI